MRNFAPLENHLLFYFRSMETRKRRVGRPPCEAIEERQRSLQGKVTKVVQGKRRGRPPTKYVDGENTTPRDIANSFANEPGNESKESTTVRDSVGNECDADIKSRDSSANNCMPDMNKFVVLQQSINKRYRRRAIPMKKKETNVSFGSIQDNHNTTVEENVVVKKEDGDCSLPPPSTLSSVPSSPSRHGSRSPSPQPKKLGRAPKPIRKPKKTRQHQKDSAPAVQYSLTDIIAAVKATTPAIVRRLTARRPKEEEEDGEMIVEKKERKKYTRRDKRVGEDEKTEMMGRYQTEVRIVPRQEDTDVSYVPNMDNCTRTYYPPVLTEDEHKERVERIKRWTSLVEASQDSANHMIIPKHEWTCEHFVSKSFAQSVFGNEKEIVEEFFHVEDGAPFRDHFLSRSSDSNATVGYVNPTLDTVTTVKVEEMSCSETELDVSSIISGYEREEIVVTTEEAEKSEMKEIVFAGGDAGTTNGQEEVVDVETDEPISPATSSPISQKIVYTDSTSGEVTECTFHTNGLLEMCSDTGVCRDQWQRSEVVLDRIARDYDTRETPVVQKTVIVAPRPPSMFDIPPTVIKNVEKKAIKRSYTKRHTVVRECEICGKELKSPEALERHLERHRQRDIAETKKTVKPITFVDGIPRRRGRPPKVKSSEHIFDSTPKEMIPYFQSPSTVHYPFRIPVPMMPSRFPTPLPSISSLNPLSTSASFSVPSLPPTLSTSSSFSAPSLPPFISPPVYEPVVAMDTFSQHSLIDVESTNDDPVYTNL